MAWVASARLTLPRRRRTSIHPAQGFAIGLAGTRRLSAAELSATVQAPSTPAEAPVGNFLLADAPVRARDPGLTPVRAAIAESSLDADPHARLAQLLAKHVGVMSVSIDTPLRPRRSAPQWKATTAPRCAHARAGDPLVPARPRKPRPLPAAVAAARAAYRDLVPAICRAPNPNDASP